MLKTATFLLACLAVAGFLSASSCANSETDKTVLSAEDSLKARVAHGDYLVNYVAVCTDCHGKHDLTKFSLPPIPGTEGIGGNFPFGEPEGLPAEVFAPNITPGRLKDWTDQELITAITHGVNRAGDTLIPIMPYHNYAHMAPDDLNAVIAYLRTLPASDSTVPPRKLFVPSMAVFGPLPESNLAANVKPDSSDKQAYGRYLVTLASCGDCHTPRNEQGIPDFSRNMAGGFIFKTPMFTVGVANVTPDSLTGIGTWSEADFVKKFRDNSSETMVNRDPGKNNTVMPWARYGKMKDSDLKAIYAYLRSLPPVTSKVTKWPE